MLHRHWAESTDENAPRGTLHVKGMELGGHEVRKSETDNECR